MEKNLVIVESPAKAKTIEKFLGKDYKVMSSYGHIRDLKKKELSIDDSTLTPEYGSPSITAANRCATSPLPARTTGICPAFIRLSANLVQLRNDCAPTAVSMQA